MRGQKRVEDARERAYVPRIHRKKFFRSGWIAGSSPAMTKVAELGQARVRWARAQQRRPSSRLVAESFAVIPISRCQTAQIYSFPRLLVPAARFPRPGFATLLHSPRIEGWAERRETFGCSAEHPCGTP